MLCSQSCRVKAKELVEQDSRTARPALRTGVFSQTGGAARGYSGLKSESGGSKVPSGVHVDINKSE